MENLNTTYLSHHGIQGMRWGVRRFQNKDGSLTKAGERRYNKEVDRVNKDKAKLAKEKAELSNRKKTQAKIEKLEKMKAKVKSDREAVAEENKRLKSEQKQNKKAEREAAKNEREAKKRQEEQERDEEQKAKAAEQRERDFREGKISTKDMTDEELQRSVNRSRMEQEYNRLNPPEVSKGKALANTIVKDVITPALTNAGRTFAQNALNKFGEKMLGSEVDPDSIQGLKKTLEKLELQKKIKDLKNPEESLDKKIKDLENKRRYDDLNDDEYQRLKREADKAKFEFTINNAQKIKSQSTSQSSDKSSKQPSNESSNNDKKKNATEVKPEEVLGKTTTNNNVKSGNDWVEKSTKDWDVKAHTPPSDVRKNGEEYMKWLLANEEEFLKRFK